MTSHELRMEAGIGPGKEAKKRARRRLTLAVFPTVGPISLWIVIFVLAPVAVILYFSFLTMGSGGEVVPGLSLANYRFLFTSSSQFGQAIFRSLSYAFLTNVACLLIGYPMAYWIARNGGRFKSLLLFMVIAPSWSCYIVRIYALKQLIGFPGILNNLLLNLGLLSTPFNILYTPTSVVLGLIYIWLPFMVLPIYASLEGINPALLEASLDLGATPVRQFLTVTLPLTKGGIIGGTILTFIPALGDWLVPQLIGGNKVWMAGNLIENYFLVIGNIYIAASMAVFLTATVVLIIYMCIKLGGEAAMERIV